MTSVQYCSTEMLERYKKIQYLQKYIVDKSKEIEVYNKEQNIDYSSIVNGRHLTNIGTFRAYIAHYLKNHSGVHKEMFQLVRQLDPTKNGLPIEIYAFSKSTAWADYEAVQADIFDHILAVMPEFDLRVFQGPTGHDIKHTQL